MSETTPRILPWTAVSAMIPYTRQHILRLEKEGKFPRRVTVGRRRVGWVASEVEDWINTRVSSRASH